jgi:hypothetical protein
MEAVLSGLRPRRAVLLVADVLAPGDGAAGVVNFLHSHVGHEAIRRRSVPVVLIGLEVDGFPWPNLLYPSAAALAKAESFGDMNRLP